MTFAHNLSRRAALAAALAGACALAPGTLEPGAAAAIFEPGGDSLSPRLAELAKPSVQGLPPVKQARRLDIAVEGPGSLLRRGKRVLVEVRFDPGAFPELDSLRSTGASIVAANRRYQTATVAIAPASLRELAGASGVQAVSEVRAPLIYGVEPAEVGAECEGGSVISEGVKQLHADEARSKYDVSGNGVTVGILSDSYNTATSAAGGSQPIATHAGEDVASGDLPGSANPCPEERTPVGVLEDFGTESGDEGRAMAQTVHDLAPAASLAFATAFTGELGFAKNIEKLALQARVLVDDVAYFEEPFFQDGPVAAAVDKVAGKGVAYFSAAGNDNLIDGGGNEIASWEAPAFRDAGGCPPVVEKHEGFNGTHCMNFKPNAGEGPDTTFSIDVQGGATLTVDLQWAEPWYGVVTDLDAFLLNSESKIVSAAYENNVGNPPLKEEGSQKPVEVLQWENTAASSQTVRLVINRFSGLAPRLKFALLENGSGVSETEYPKSSGEDVVGPTIFGHTAAQGAMSVAAMRYSRSSQPERYSSRGPVHHYFKAVKGTLPALPLLPGETAIAKPDITATDCGATTFFASFVASEATWRFCGTSAAAPHAAGVAALQLEANPAASVSEIRQAQAATAVPIGAFGPDAVGAGLIDADAAVASMLPASAVFITGHPASRTADNTPSFEFEANEGTPTFICSIDAENSEPCSSPYTTPAPLPDGPHKFVVEAMEGTTTTGEASFTFTVDTTPPVISIAPQPPVTANPTPSFAFSANEPASFTCALDGAVAKACDSPFVPAAPLSEGPHTFEVTATDQVGHSSRASLQITVDRTTLAVSITSRPAQITNDRTPSFGFAANEPVAFSCSLDAAPLAPCNSPFVPPQPLADGLHGFAVRGVDAAGRAATSETVYFTVDTTPPRTFFAGHPAHKVRTRTARARALFRFRSNEDGALFVCRIDTDLFRFCPTRLARRFKAGRHTVRVKAVDQAGNTDPTPAVFHFQVKRVGHR